MHIFESTIGQDHEKQRLLMNILMKTSGSSGQLEKPFCLN